MVTRRGLDRRRPSRRRRVGYACERELQRAVAAFLHRHLPEDAVWTHVMNEGPKGNYVAAAWGKALGVRAGWPDITIIYDGRAFLIELKSRIGQLSPAQKLCHRDLSQAGSVPKVCRSVDAVEAELRKWRVPLRGGTLFRPSLACADYSQE